MRFYWQKPKRTARDDILTAYLRNEMEGATETHGGICLIYLAERVGFEPNRVKVM
jgi:hypothetical protein